jgi:phosphoglycolate phosphatase
MAGVTTDLRNLRPVPAPVPKAAPAPVPSPAPAAAAPAAAGPLTVGFDLDMTLIDSRPGIKAVWDRLSAETGVFIDSALAVTRLGPPLDEELANWFPAEEVPAMSERYRALYPEHAIAPTPAMPGAVASVEAVRAAGGRPLVVTAKYAPNARLHLDHLGIDAELRGWLWAEAKAEALIEYGASVYVGDHTGDIRGARAAGALSVAVATGPCGAAELRAAGADVVLDDLTQFPDWLADYASAAA